MNCPKCETDQKFSSKIYEGVVVDVCPNCLGVWLEEHEITKILNTNIERFSPELISETVNAAFTGVPEDEIRSEEDCPKCNELMIAVNYAYSSGIIVDRCLKSHGIWLDHM